MRVSYCAILDALGFYVERADGGDVFVQELPPDGYLLAFLAGDEQQAVTFEAHEIESVHDEAEKHPNHSGQPSRRCAALNLGGRYYCRNCAAPLTEQAAPARGRGAHRAQRDSAAWALTLAFANGQSYRLDDNEVIVGCAAAHDTWRADLDVTLYG